MTDSVRKRIEAINKSEDAATLKKHVCPFFEKGGHTDCITCMKDDESVEICKNYYLERIAMHPMDIWCEEFDKIQALPRDKVSLDELQNVGTTCDNCYMNERCPLFKKGYVCCIDWQSKKPSNATEFMDFLIGMQYERVRRSAMFEKIDGGVPDLGLSGEMDRLNNYIMQKDNLGRDRLSINVEASSSASSGGGILAKLFGGAGKQEEPKELPVAETEFEEIPAEKEKVKIPIKRK